jgi:hypothetical protein
MIFVACRRDLRAACLRLLHKPFKKRHFSGQKHRRNSNKVDEVDGRQAKPPVCMAKPKSSRSPPIPHRSARCRIADMFLLCSKHPA